MIAAWMLHGILVSGLVFLLAERLEVARVGRSRSVRFVWLGSMAVSLLALGPLVRGRSTLAAPGEVGTGASAFVAGEPGRWLSSIGAIGTLDLVLLMGWALASGVLLAYLLVSAMAIRRASAGWRRIALHGVPVAISGSTGPAVVGLGEPEIVLPRWALGLDASAQRLLVRHEQEHLWCSDPLLVHASLLLTAVFPWNLGLWLQARRLREAVEIDCDARVCSRTRNRDGYPQLLLVAAERRVRPVPQLFALAAARPPLERRIRILTGSGTLPPHLRAVTARALVVALMAAMVLVPRPGPGQILDMARAGWQRMPSLGGAGAPGPDRPPELIDVERMSALLAGAYPRQLREAGVGGTTLVAAFVTADGKVARTRVVGTSGRLELDAAAEEAALWLSYRPALVQGVPTGAWVQQPMIFRAPARPEEPGDGLQPPDAGPRLAIWSTPRPVVPPVR